jgi:ATP-dependent Lhr-like helicase
MSKLPEISMFVHWFASKGWTPFEFQTDTWQAYAEGKHGLLNAPTGSGKTYALWVPIFLDILKFKAAQQRKTSSLKAVWITPLRALSIEIQQAAEQLIDDLNLDMTIGIRTGDTPQSDRAKQKRNMPDLLVTTPESLQLLLASKGYPKTFRDCQAIVVDEWHELLGTKRGVQMELALSRFKTINPKLSTSGRQSKTIG